MKIKSNYVHHEFDIGALINNDEAFKLARRRLSPDQFMDDRLKKLVSIMVDVGNDIFEIMRVDKEMANYAMELANQVARWQMQLQHASHESLKEESSISMEESLINYLPECQRKHAKGESYKFLCDRLNIFFNQKNNYEDNRQALKLARDNFESYCEMKERI